MQLYEKIKFLRKQAGITQSDLADKLFVTRQSVQKWEAGLANPDVSKLREIAGIFHVSVDSLFDDEKGETALIAEVAGVNAEEKAHGKEITRSALDYLVIIPAWVGVGILYIMAYAMPAMAVAMCFSIAFGAPVYGLYSIVNVFLSMGIGARLVAVGFGLIGLGLGWPSYRLGIRLFNEYKRLLVKLNTDVKRAFRRFVK